MTATRSLFTITVALTAALTFASCAERRLNSSPMDSQHFDKKFTVNAGGTLKVVTDVGTVRVRGGAGNEVSVVADMHGRERDLEKFHITADQQGNDVEVRGEFSGRGSSWFGGINNFDADFVVTVPKEYNVDIKTSGGNIEITAIKGTVRGGTSGGDVNVHDVEGPITTETSGGTVVAEKVAGDVRMSTSGGDVHAKAITGNINVKTSGGNVEVDGTDGEVEARTSGGNVSIRVAGKNKGIYAETSGGNVDFYVPKDIGAEVDLSTSGGEVTCDMPITVSGKIRSDEIRGTLNGGGARLYGHTSGGNVTVRENK
ncbi:MAG: DUF4097 family beta strand repeat-containing protein [Bacteroidota bacterium]